MLTSKFVIGFDFRSPSPSQDAVLVLRNDTEKITIPTIDGYLYAAAAETAEWKPGEYQYQILDATGLKSYGNIELMPNFASAAAGVTVKSHAQEMVDAIEAVIEGRATQAQKHVTVGDKSLEYMDFDQLMKYLDYFKQKVAKEEGASSPNDQKVIRFAWR